MVCLNFLGLTYDLGTKLQAYTSDYDYGATKRKKNMISNDFTLQHIILNFSLFLFFKINIICLPY